jgi:hypothetical protein
MKLEWSTPRIVRTIPGLAAAAFLLHAGAAGAAGVPSPPNCTFDHVIIGSYDLTGAPSGPAPCLATATPGFDVWVRDLNNLPVPGAVVQIIFAGTGTSIRPYRNQLQSNVTVRCGNHELDVVADANGHAVFVPRFGRYGEIPVVPVYANGVLLGNVEARSADYNDDGTVNLIDLGIFTTDYTDPLSYHPKSDFDDCPNTNLGDFAFFAEQYLASISGPIEQVCP